MMANEIRDAAFIRERRKAESQLSAASFTERFPKTPSGVFVWKLGRVCFPRRLGKLGL